MKSQPTLANPRRRSAIGFALSLLLHALILFHVADQTPPMDLNEPGTKGDQPLTIRLLPMARPVPQQQQQQRPLLEPPPQAKQAVRKTPERPTQAKKQSASPKKTEAKKPLPLAEKAPTRAAPAADISDMLAAARERRRAAGIEEPDSSEQEQPQDDNAIARANIQHMLNMQSRGQQESGGVFQITYKGVRTAEFIFRGWNVRRRNDTRQLIQVDAGLNGDVDTAIVRRMIQLIRQTERGDFHWESRRLGRIVVLSARPQDSAELEDFLKKEFRLDP